MSVASRKALGVGTLEERIAALEQLFNFREVILPLSVAEPADVSGTYVPLTRTLTTTTPLLIDGVGSADLSADRTLSHADSGVIANTYGTNSAVGAFTVDALGHITSAGNTNIQLAASAITSGLLALARGGTAADLSATGGTGQVVKQESAGAAFTVGALVASEIPSLSTTKITSDFPWDVAEGGTGRTSLTADAILYGNGTSAVSLLSKGAANEVLTMSAAAVYTWRPLVRANVGASTGTGDTFVFSTTPTLASPTCTTQITTPKVTGTTDLYAVPTSGSLRWDGSQVWWENIPAYSSPTATEIKRVADFAPTITMSPTGLFNSHELYGLSVRGTVTSAAGTAGLPIVAGLLFQTTFNVGQNVSVFGISANPTVTNTVAAGSFGVFELFAANPTITSATASVAPYGAYILASLPIVTFSGTGTATMAPAAALPSGSSSNTAVIDNARYSNTSSGTFNFDHAGFEHCVQLTESAGSLVASSIRGLRVRTPVISGSPAITEHIGVDVASIDSGGVTTLACSLRSASATVEMRHEGPVYLGADTVAPDTILHIAASSAKRGAITLQEDSTHPTGPTAVDRCRLYMRNDKLIVQVYNTTVGGGQTVYFYLDLTATTNQSWIYSASAPA